MNILAKTLLRIACSLLLALLIFAAIAEVIYFTRAITSSSPTVLFVPIPDIHLFYLSYFSFGIDNIYIVIFSTVLWFLGWTTYIFFRLSERSRGVKFKYLTVEFVVVATWFFAVANLALGMFLAAMLIFLTVPVFIFLPISVRRGRSGNLAFEGKN